MKKLLKKLLGIKEKKSSVPKIKWSLYGRVWKEIGLPYWKWLVAGVLCTVVAAGAEGYSVTLVKKVIDSGFISQDMNLLYLLGAQIIFAFFLKGVFSYSKSLIMSKTGLKTSANLLKKLYARLAVTDIDNIYRDGVGRYIDFFGNQANAVLALVTTQVIKVVQDTASIAIMIGLMVWYAPKLVIILLLLVPALLIPLVIISHQKNKMLRKSMGISNVASQHIAQSLSGIKTIQSFGMEASETSKYDIILQKTYKNSYKITRIGSLRAPLMELVISVGLGISLVVGGYLVSRGRMSTGDFTAFILALTAAYKPAKAITGVNDGMQRGLIASEILFNFLDSAPTIRDTKDAVDLTGDKMRIVFKNISFAYNKADGDVLHGIDLEAEPEKTYALVGPSGGGKTTMFSLIQRFYDPSSGHIMINGKDIKKYTLASLRKNIAEVSQDVFLFNGSVEENIKYGAPSATHEQVVQAAKIANAHNFIMELPHQYNSRVGERGTMLSGGQKQRIAIARAVLKDSPILLLDEATSALDTESEKLIQSALTKLMKGRTVFVIAHRLSTILDADKIYVIKGGKIIESGTDNELIALNGEYKKLRDIQFREKTEVSE